MVHAGMQPMARPHVGAMMDGRAPQDARRAIAFAQCKRAMLIACIATDQGAPTARHALFPSLSDSTECASLLAASGITALPMRFAYHAARLVLLAFEIKRVPLAQLQLRSSCALAPRSNVSQAAGQAHMRQSRWESEVVSPVTPTARCALGGSPTSALTASQTAAPHRTARLPFVLFSTRVTAFHSARWASTIAPSGACRVIRHVVHATGLAAGIVQAALSELTIQALCVSSHARWASSSTMSPACASHAIQCVRAVMARRHPAQAATWTTMEPRSDVQWYFTAAPVVLGAQAAASARCCALAVRAIPRARHVYLGTAHRTARRALVICTTTPRNAWRHVPRATLVDQISALNAIGAARAAPLRLMPAHAQRVTRAQRHLIWTSSPRIAPLAHGALPCARALARLRTRPPEGADLATRSAPRAAARPLRSAQLAPMSQAF